MRKRARSLKSLERREPHLVARECILIVCEGGKTEPLYFKSFTEKLRLSNEVEVVVEGSREGSAPISVVDHAITRRAERKSEARTSPLLTEFDAVWCVIDVEAPQPHESLNRAFDKANSSELRVALSNPCFEYWYILHFEKAAPLFHANKDVVKRLRKHYQDYQKNSPDTFERVFPSTETAIKNAELVIKERKYGKDLRTCNPSTHVHLLVKHLSEMAARSVPRR